VNAHGAEDGKNECRAGQTVPLRTKEVRSECDVEATVWMAKRVRDTSMPIDLGNAPAECGNPLATAGWKRRVNPNTEITRVQILVAEFQMKCEMQDPRRLMLTIDHTDVTG